MKIFTTRQIADIDHYTIHNEPVSDIDLMERAALQIVNWLIHHIPGARRLLFFAGPGNNGGDAMAVARMMANRNYPCELFLLDLGKELRGSPAINLRRLEDQRKVKIKRITSEADLPEIPPDVIVLDGLFGSGLARQLEGLAEKTVAVINGSGSFVIAIDIPSGLFGEDNSSNDLSKVIRARHTLTFQFPKLSFFFPEHESILGQWEVLPIGLHPGAVTMTETPFYFLSSGFVASKLMKRKRFAHKGNFGHALLIAGTRCKMGAAVLASKACLRSGVGLLTTHVPNPGVPIIQIAVPEAMCSADASDLMFTEFPVLSPFTAVGVGPGIGLKTNTQRALHDLLEKKPEKIVLDADALNILSCRPEWLSLLPENAILTPHPKEFERLAGATSDSWSRLQVQTAFSKKYKVITVLKGAHTCITFPQGNVFFNTTGNPGMATAGSGDVLTGLILGLLAQPYSPADAALIGVYVHGLAGDLAAGRTGEESLISGDLTEFQGEAFLHIRNQNSDNSHSPKKI